MPANNQKWIGQSIERFEDQSLLKGEGKYLDDINLDGQLYMKVFRSPIARGTIRSLQTAEASKIPGVVAIFTAKDIEGMLNAPVVAAAPGVKLAELDMVILAKDRVNYVGDPLAVVIATSKAICEDAISMIELDYEIEVPIVSTAESVLDRDLIHPQLQSNVMMQWDKKSANFDASIAKADLVVEATLELPRLVAAPMEPRGCLVNYHQESDKIDLWASSQDPHRPTIQLAHALGIPQENVRTIIPEVGGAFGSKGGAPQEYILACASSKMLGRPVKWTEDRTENFLASYQGRGMSANIKLGLTSEGKLLTIEANILADLGAYLFPSTPIAPYTAATLLCGGYRIEAVNVSLRGVATNKVPTGPYRGAGRPEACYFIEQMIDIASRKLGIDPLELRIKNLISQDEFPYQTPLGPIYDSGDYQPPLLRATELLAQHQFESGSQSNNEWISSKAVVLSVEPAGAGFWESGAVEIQGSGKVIAISGSSPHGQGHKTTFAQILADHLGVLIDTIEIKQGDSINGPGIGTFGSRSVLLGGEALVIAAKEVKEIAASWASKKLEASIEDLVWEGDEVHVQGSPEPSLSLFQIAKMMEESNETVSLKSATRSNTPGPTFPFGAYGAAVKINTETGQITLDHLIAVDDAGIIINPMLAEGQIVGSSLQGISSALWEEMYYDPDGTPITSSFVDYLIPTAKETGFHTTSEFRNTPTPYTTLGAKGVGESGTVGALSAVASAINYGLASLGVETHVEPAYSPEKIWRAIHKNKG